MEEGFMSGTRFTCDIREEAGRWAVRAFAFFLAGQGQEKAAKRLLDIVGRHERSEIGVSKKVNWSDVHGL